MTFRDVSYAPWGRKPDKIRVTFEGMEAKANISQAKDRRISGSVFPEAFRLAVALFMVLLFGYTGIDKLINYEVFVFQMRLVSVGWIQEAAPILGLAVPITELGIAAALIAETTRGKALIASLLLMISFETYIAWMQLTGLELPCTCGGIISKMSWPAHTIFNAIVILLLIIALYLKNGVLDKGAGD